MLGPLIAIALFCGVVWVIAHAIFLLMRGDRTDDVSPEHRRDTLAAFVEENYGSHFMHEDSREPGSLRNF